MFISATRKELLIAKKIYEGFCDVSSVARNPEVVLALWRSASDTITFMIGNIDLSGLKASDVGKMINEEIAKRNND